MSTISAPSIVRLIRFPKTLTLDKKGNRYVGPLRRSGPVILSERHDPVECTFRITDPGLTFETGGTTVQGVEAFNEGEQRDLLLPWALVAEGKLQPPMIVMEIDVNYEGSSEKHTATIPLILKYGNPKRRVVGAVAAAAAAVAVAAVAKGRKKATVIDDDDDVEVALFNIAPTSRTKTTAARTNVKGAKVRVVDEDDVNLAVLNVGRKTSGKKKESSLSSKKKKKASSAKKKAPAKKAGAPRRGSSASRSAPRKDARGSSKGRKAAPRRTTRKSR